VLCCCWDWRLCRDHRSLEHRNLKEYSRIPPGLLPVLSCTICALIYIFILPWLAILFVPLPRSFSGGWRCRPFLKEHSLEVANKQSSIRYKLVVYGWDALKPIPCTKNQTKMFRNNLIFYQNIIPLVWDFSQIQYYASYKPYKKKTGQVLGLAAIELEHNIC
jgi:hypothetical protein